MNNIRKTIEQALREDLPVQDITTNVLIPGDKTSRAYIITKQEAVLCGLQIAKKVFQRLDKNISFRSPYSDGERVPANTRIAFLRGKTRAILSGERVALNFLSHLSGIATKTHNFVKKIRPLKVKILDTRKTIPGLRNLAKYAVQCGEGKNHRMHLGSMALIKDNHRAACHRISLDEIIQKTKKATHKHVEVEVNTLPQFKTALKGNPDMILLDNMSLRQIKEAVRITRSLRPSPLLEVSGNVSLKNVRRIAKTGVDRISIGALTHTVQAIDLSLELIP